MIETKLPLILKNTFLSNTAKSMELAQSQISYHYSRLNSRADDPVIAPLYDSFQPLGDAFFTAYDQWQSSGDLRIGQTDDLDRLFREESERIRIWNSRMLVLLENNPMLYKQLMPHGLSPFQKGKQNDRLDALNQLVQKMAGVTILDTLRNDILGFATQINGRYNEQKDAIGNVEILRMAMENARVAATIAMWANLGYLNWKYPEFPETVQFYFDFDELLKGEQRRFVNTRLKPLTNDFIAKRSLELDHVIELNNKGAADLWLFAGESKTSGPVNPYVIIRGGQQRSIVRSELGAGSFFFVHNPSDLATGNFFLEFK